MNTRAKGNRFQDRIEKLLKSWGWTVHNQKTVSSLVKIRRKDGRIQEVWISKRNDILGCIDITARKPGEKPLHIQATLHGDLRKRTEQLRTIPWALGHEDVQIWQGKEAGEIIIWQFDGSGLKELMRIIRGKIYKLEGLSDSLKETIVKIAREESLPESPKKTPIEISLDEGLEVKQG